jgi:hypothetical protein
VQKLASAAKISFTKQSLLQDHNRLLYRINSEAKVRRPTRSLVIGTAKVMEWEDLERARAERTSKDKAAADKGKGKRGRKRKLFAREADGDVEEVRRAKSFWGIAKAPSALVPWYASQKRAAGPSFFTQLSF